MDEWVLIIFHEARLLAAKADKEFGINTKPAARCQHLFRILLALMHPAAGEGSIINFLNY